MQEILAAQYASLAWVQLFSAWHLLNVYFENLLSCHPPGVPDGIWRD
jgi:hypothetical protein